MQRQHCVALFLVVFLIVTPIFLSTCKAQIVDDNWANSIDNAGLEIDQRTSAEVVVAVFPSLYGHGITDSSGNEINDIVQLGVYIFNEYPLDASNGQQTGIGKAGKDNGVLIIVAIEEKQWRIEVGYGLEGDITDVQANDIARQYLVPAFQLGNYGEGLYNTVVALGQLIPNATDNNLPVRGYYYYEADNTPTDTGTDYGFWGWNFYGLPWWAILILVILGIVFPVFGSNRRGGGRSGGGGAGGRW
jgi:uncharacterized protein